MMIREPRNQTEECDLLCFALGSLSVPPTGKGTDAPFMVISLEAGNVSNSH